MVGIAVAAGALGISYWKGYRGGAKSRDAEIVALKLDSERQRLAALAAEERANEAAQKVRVEYRTKVETIIQEAEAAEKIVEVIKREADPNCVLPPAYRELWNGPDNSGGAKDKPAPRVDAAPVALADAAAAAAEAKARFEQNAARLEALQNYISQIQDAPLPK